MTVKALAHTAYQSLKASTDCALRHSHTHELLAAAFGYGSWASLQTDALLIDAGLGTPPAASAPALVVGRALQLSYPRSAAQALALRLTEFVAERQLGVIRWSDFAPLLCHASTAGTGWQPRTRTLLDMEDDDFDLDADNDDDPYTDAGNRKSAESTAAVRPLPHIDALLGNALLLDGLMHAANNSGRASHAHHVLAALHRCPKPNPYLWEEAQKGRILAAAEQRWVDAYLVAEPKYRAYEAHLKVSALGGSRAAALEYGMTFDAPSFIDLAEQLAGEVDALQMARAATTDAQHDRWMRQAAEAGSPEALKFLASRGEHWAQDRVAAQAGLHWLRAAAEHALDEGDAMRAWTWQYLALSRGKDLTRSTLAARHDGGVNDGDFYDDDVGGPLYVDGDEGLVLPAVDHATHLAAKNAAHRIAAG